MPASVSVRTRLLTLQDNPPASGTYSTIYFPSHDVAVEGGLGSLALNQGHPDGGLTQDRGADPTQSAGGTMAGRGVARGAPAL